MENKTKRKENGEKTKETKLPQTIHYENFITLAFLVSS